MNSFSDFYYTTYSTKTLSFEQFFCLFTYFLIFAVPFYFAFGGSNFWFQQMYGSLDIRYSFTGFYAVEVSYLEGDVNTVQQYCNIPNSPMNSLQQVYLNAQEQDLQTSITLTIDAFDNKQIQSLNFILYYNIQIPQLQKVYSAASPFSISGNIYSAEISGKLTAQALQPINGLTQKDSQTVNTPIYYARNFATIATYQELMEKYLTSQIRIQSDIHISTTQAMKESRKVTINLSKDTKVVLSYYPSILQTLKLKFSRYVGFLILSYLIFRNIMVMLIEEEGLECHRQIERPPVKNL